MNPAESNAFAALIDNVGRQLSDSLTVDKNHTKNQYIKGKKSKLHAKILKRAQKQRRTINNKSNPALTKPPSLPTSDRIQEKLGRLAVLEREYCDLVEAYELLLEDRVRVENIIGEGEIEGFDDLEVFERYWESLREKLELSQREIRRLTEHSQGNAAIEYSVNNDNHSNAIQKVKSEEGPSQFNKPLPQKAESGSSQNENDKNKLLMLEAQNEALSTKIAYLQSTIDTLRNLTQHKSNSDLMAMEATKETQIAYNKCKQKLDLILNQNRVLKSQLEEIREEALFYRKKCEAEGSKDEACPPREPAESSSVMKDASNEINIADKSAQNKTRDKSVTTEIIPPLSSSTTTKPIPKDNQKPSTASHDAQAVAMLKRECERLALENARLTSSNNTAYTRCTIIKYLQMPTEQRRHLAPLLTRLLKLSAEDVSLIKWN